MGILRNITSEFDTYENQTEGKLVAIHREHVKNIKAYFKKYKGKTDKPKEQVPGHPFILDEEYDSLKIDFDTVEQYAIRDLERFK